MALDPLTPSRRGTDVLKWVSFARRVFLVILLSIVTMAGVSAFISTRQAGGLLRESLAGEARAIADSAARAAFVPLTLQDDASLAALIDSYRVMEHLGRLRVRDASGRVRRELDLTVVSPARLLEAQAPILPPAEDGAPGAAARPIGLIEVGMRTRWIDDKARRIALTNVALMGGAAAVIAAVVILLVGNLVARTRELVGEARLVEEVKRANAELEAFSYSVAHDLRAPLRHIGGYIEILQGAAAGKLDEPARRCLDKITGASVRMGRMIDDLLSFSRMGRKELQTQSVDLGELVAETLRDLQHDVSGRRVEWRVAALPRVEGDRAMLKLVFSNLLGNAVKFTRGRDPAVIEIGARQDRPDRLTVFVRDNGAGFDMRYVEKLFGVFQRLHAQDEFEGTGIGLANVRRIVVRHGGQAWAEGKVGEGAVFFFSLPAKGRRT